MRKVTILQVLLFWVVAQTSLAILYRYEVIDSKWLVYLPSIILFGISFLVIFITWFSYKYFNNGRGNWND